MTWSPSGFFRAALNRVISDDSSISLIVTYEQKPSDVSCVRLSLTARKKNKCQQFFVKLQSSGNRIVATSA